MQCNTSKIAYVIPGSIIYSNVSNTEPVTLEQAKKYMHVGFDDDDDLITDLITEAREWAEEKTGLSLVSRTIDCTVNCPYGQSIELPYGPVKYITTALPDNRVQNGEFPRIKDIGGQVNVTYATGYDELPKALKRGILAKVASMYENRGDQNNANDGVAINILSPFKRITGWL